MSGGATGTTNPYAPSPAETTSKSSKRGGGGTKQPAPTGNGAASAGTTGAAPSSPSRTGPQGQSVAKDKPQTGGKRKPSGQPKQTTAGGTPTGPSVPPTAGGSAQEVMRRKAKRVCRTLGVSSLAATYHVKASAEAVATAYANSYPAPLRNAVHDGCLAGITP